MRGHRQAEVSEPGRCGARHGPLSADDNARAGNFGLQVRRVRGTSRGAYAQAGAGAVWFVIHKSGEKSEPLQDENRQDRRRER